jgi:hypothetical protein
MGLNRGASQPPSKIDSRVQQQTAARRMRALYACLPVPQPVRSPRFNGYLQDRFGQALGPVRSLTGERRLTAEACGGRASASEAD